MGMIFNMPLPQMLKTITIAKAIMASGQFAEQLSTAEPERPKPMAMMIGPVTTGGKAHNLVNAHNFD